VTRFTPIHEKTGDLFYDFGIIPERVDVGDTLDPWYKPDGRGEPESEDAGGVGHVGAHRLNRGSIGQRSAGSVAHTAGSCPGTTVAPASRSSRNRATPRACASASCPKGGRLPPSSVRAK